MKIISLHQPWASLIACGAKQIETRSWRTEYRGPIAIHAAKTWTPALRDMAGSHPSIVYLPSYPWEPPLGCIVAVAQLVGVFSTDTFSTMPMNCGPHEREFGDYSKGRWAWILKDIRPLTTPYPYKGSQGLRYLPRPIEGDILQRVS